MTLEPTSNSSCFSGVIVDDQIALEGIEDFSLQLRDPNVAGLVIGNDATIVNIIDDDRKRTYKIAHADTIGSFEGEHRSYEVQG